MIKFIKLWFCNHKYDISFYEARDKKICVLECIYCPQTKVFPINEIK